MKKIISLFIVLFVLSSCSDDVRFNTKALQGIKDGVLWRSGDCKATIGAGNALTIVAVSKYETVTLKTTSTNVAIYPLGTSDSKKASYAYAKGNEAWSYATGIDSGEGQIEITEFDPTNMTVSGKFRFNAKITVSNALVSDNIVFQEGIFYKVPIAPSL